jgi:hypothetical protein
MATRHQKPSPRLHRVLPATNCQCPAQPRWEGALHNIAKDEEEWPRVKDQSCSSFCWLDKKTGEIKKKVAVSRVYQNAAEIFLILVRYRWANGTLNPTCLQMRQKTASCIPPHPRESLSACPGPPATNIHVPHACHGKKKGPGPMSEDGRLLGLEFQMGYGVMKTRFWGSFARLSSSSPLGLVNLSR